MKGISSQRRKPQTRQPDDFSHGSVAPAPAQRWRFETQTQIWCPQRRNTGSSSWQQAIHSGREKWWHSLLSFFVVADLSIVEFGYEIFWGNIDFLSTLYVFQFSVSPSWLATLHRSHLTRAPQSRAVSHPRLLANRNHRFAWWQSWQKGKDSSLSIPVEPAPSQLKNNNKKPTLSVLGGKHAKMFAKMNDPSANGSTYYLQHKVTYIIHHNQLTNPTSHASAIQPLLPTDPTTSPASLWKKMLSQTFENCWTVDFWVVYAEIPMSISDMFSSWNSRTWSLHHPGSGWRMRNVATPSIRGQRRSRAAGAPGAARWRPQNMGRCCTKFKVEIWSHERSDLGGGWTNPSE